MGFTIAYKIFNFNWEGSWSVVPGTFNAVNNIIYVYKDKDFEKQVFITFDSYSTDQISNIHVPLINSGSYTLNNFRTNSTEFSVTTNSINNSSQGRKYEVTDEHYINISRKC